MSNWLSLVIGVIIGLIFGWLIDMFWRRRPEVAGHTEDAIEPTRAVEWTLPTPPPVAEPPLAPETAPAVEPPLPPEAGAEVTRAAEVAAQVEADAPGVDWPEISERVAQVGEELQETVAEVRTEIAELPEKAERFVSGALDALAPAPAEELRAPGKDDLTRIEGIGRVYDGRLRAAGINTFAELVAAGEARLQEIIQPQAWQRVNFGEWIEQARLIVEGNEEELRVLQEKLFRRKKG